MHIVYSIAARFTFFFKETVSFTLWLRLVSSPLKKPTFYHSDAWSDLTAPIVKHLDQVITSFIAKGPCTHLSILVP